MRVFSEKRDLKFHVEDHKGWLLRRGDTQRVVEEQVDGAFRLSLEHDTQQNKKESGYLLLIIPHLVYLRYSGKNLITFTAYRSARNLARFLVRSKVYPLERTAGSSKCGSKRCQVCLNVSETDIFESFQTKKQ